MNKDKKKQSSFPKVASTPANAISNKDSSFSLNFFVQTLILISIVVGSSYFIVGRKFTYVNNPKDFDKSHANSQICFVLNEYPETVHVYYNNVFEGFSPGDNNIFLFTLGTYLYIVINIYFVSSINFRMYT